MINRPAAMLMYLQLDRIPGRRHMLKIRFSNRIGLLALLGVIAGIVLIGLTYPANPYLAVLAGVLAITSFVVFVIYLYNFIFYSPALELPDEDTVEEKE
jgi:O-antigen ligase